MLPPHQLASWLGGLVALNSFDPSAALEEGLMAGCSSLLVCNLRSQQVILTSQPFSEDSSLC